LKLEVYYREGFEGLEIWKLYIGFGIMGLAV